MTKPSCEWCGRESWYLHKHRGQDICTSCKNQISTRNVSKEVARRRWALFGGQPRPIWHFIIVFLVMYGFAFIIYQWVHWLGILLGTGVGVYAVAFIAGVVVPEKGQTHLSNVEFVVMMAGFWTIDVVLWNFYHWIAILCGIFLSFVSVVGLLMILFKGRNAFADKQGSPPSYPKEIKHPSYTMSELGVMSGIEFEDALKNVFQSKGYNVTKTPASHDQGVDLILEKDGLLTAVQAKRYAGHVSNKAVQEVYAGKGFYGCERAIVVTNSQFTKSAARLAKTLNVELIDNESLSQFIHGER